MTKVINVCIALFFLLVSSSTIVSHSPKTTEYVRESALLDAIEYVESRSNTRAVSRAGAKGAYQLMPVLVKHYNIDPFNKEQARQAAKKHINYLFSKHNGNLEKTLASYNWGENNVKKKGMSSLPKETKNYIKRVTNRLKELGNGDK